MYVEAEKYSSSHVLARYHAAALLRAGQPKKAGDLLKKVLRSQPEDPELHKMLATAAGGTGALLEAHQAMAEYYYLKGNLPAAIEQLRIATRFAGDNYYLQSSLEARIKEISEAQSTRHLR